MNLNPIFPSLPSDIKRVIYKKIIEQNEFRQLAKLRLVSKFEQDFIDRQLTLFLSKKLSFIVQPNLSLKKWEEFIVQNRVINNITNKRLEPSYHCTISDYKYDLCYDHVIYYYKNQISFYNPISKKRVWDFKLPKDSRNQKFLFCFEKHYFFSFILNENQYVLIHKPKEVCRYFFFSSGIGTLVKIIPDPTLKSVTAIFGAKEELIIIKQGEKKSVYSFPIKNDTVKFISEKYCIYKESNHHFLLKIIAEQEFVNKTLDLREKLLLPEFSNYFMQGNIFFGYTKETKTLKLFDFTDEKQLVELKSFELKDTVTNLQPIIKGDILYVHTKEENDLVIKFFMHIFDLQHNTLLQRFELEEDVEAFDKFHYKKFGFSYVAGKLLSGFDTYDHSLKIYDFIRLSQTFLKKKK